jgi:hypothetical protein
MDSIQSLFISKIFIQRRERVNTVAHIRKSTINEFNLPSQSKPADIKKRMDADNLCILIPNNQHEHSLDI